MLTLMWLHDIISLLWSLSWPPALSWTSSLRREKHSYERQQQRETITLTLLNFILRCNMTIISIGNSLVVIEPDYCGPNVLFLYLIDTIYIVLKNYISLHNIFKFLLVLLCCKTIVIFYICTSIVLYSFILKIFFTVHINSVSWLF